MPMRRGALWFAVLWAVAVGAYLLYGPVYASESSKVTTSLDGSRVPTTSSCTSGMGAVEGLRAYVVVLAPLVLTGVPLGARDRPVRQALAAAGAVALGAFAWLGAMTVGLFYLPAVAALAVGAAPWPRQGPAEPTLGVDGSAGRPDAWSLVHSQAISSMRRVRPGTSD